MAFEIKRENTNGMFHVKLYRDLTVEEMVQLATIAGSVVPKEDRVYGPQLPVVGSFCPIPRETSDEDHGSAMTRQKTLGERIVSTINMGEYIEPRVGVRLKMVALPGLGLRVPAIKAMRSKTGISMMGCRDITWGNYPCPIMTTEVASAVLAEFRELGVYAKMIPAGEC